MALRCDWGITSGIQQPKKGIKPRQLDLCKGFLRSCMTDGKVMPTFFNYSCLVH